MQGLNSFRTYLALENLILNFEFARNSALMNKWHSRRLYPFYFLNAPFREISEEIGSVHFLECRFQRLTNMYFVSDSIKM